MNNKALLLAIAATLLAGTTRAQLPEPEFVLYGEVAGQPPWLNFGSAAQLPLDVRLESDSVLLDQTVIAADGRFSLRIPMDSMGPLAAGNSREGLALDLFLNGIQLDAVNSSQPLAVPSTGPAGTYRELNIDLDSIVPGIGFSIADAQVLEGVPGGRVDVVILLNDESGTETQQVNWLNVEGTATAAAGSLCAEDDDFVPTSGIAEFAPGQTTYTVSLELCDNVVPEDTESFVVRITNPSNDVILARNEATVTIIDDDGLPMLSIGDLFVREPESRFVNANFEVTLSATRSSPVSFSYSTQDRTALAEADYKTTTGIATIPAGMSRIEIPVPVYADDERDDGEQFALVLSDPVGAEFTVSEGVATIIDSGNEGTVIIDAGGNQSTLDGPIDLTVNTAGPWLFVANQLGETISRFDIDPENGELSGEVRWSELQLQGADLGGVQSISASSDGSRLITSSRGAEGINLLAVDADGALSFAGVARNAAPDGNDRPFEGLADISAVGLSPDAAHLYVTSRSGDSVSVLSLTGDSPPSMVELEQNGVDDELDTGGQVEDLDGPSDVIVSLDGRSVYAVSPVSSAILHFSRNTDTASPFFGALSFRASYSQSSLDAPSLNGVSQLANSADGQRLYAVSPANGKVTAFGLGINGELTRIGAGATDEPGTLNNASALLASSDSESVVAASPTPGSLHVFKRMPTGNVAAVEVLIAGRDAIEGLGGASALAQPPGQSDLVYVAAFDENRVSLVEISVASLVFRDDFEN